LRWQQDGGREHRQPVRLPQGPLGRGDPARPPAGDRQMRWRIRRRTRWLALAGAAMALLCLAGPGVAQQAGAGAGSDAAPGQDEVHDLDDLLALKAEQRRKLRFGVFVASPVTDWLVQNKLMEQVDWYQHQTGDAEQYPGQVIEQDLANGKIDVAFVWGPIAG